MIFFLILKIILKNNFLIQKPNKSKFDFCVENLTLRMIFKNRKNTTPKQFL